MYDQAITIGMQLMVFMFFYVAMSLDKKHAPIQILFFIMGFWMQIINLDIMRQVATAASQAGIATTVSYGYNAIIYMSWLVVFYFIGMLVFEIRNWFKEKNGDSDE